MCCCSPFTQADRQRHTRIHIHKHLPLRVHATFVWLCAYVCELRTGWTPNEIFKKEQHITCKVLQVTSPGERGGNR